MGAIPADALMRRCERQLLVKDQQVSVVTSESAAPLVCPLHDVSLSGACLIIANDIMLPSHFKVLVGQKWRKVALRWRNNSRVGIEFVK